MGYAANYTPVKATFNTGTTELRRTNSGFIDDGLKRRLELMVASVYDRVRAISSAVNGVRV